MVYCCHAHALSWNHHGDKSRTGCAADANTRVDLPFIAGADGKYHPKRQPNVESRVLDGYDQRKRGKYNETDVLENSKEIDSDHLLRHGCVDVFRMWSFCSETPDTRSGNQSQLRIRVEKCRFRLNAISFIALTVPGKCALMRGCVSERDREETSELVSEYGPANTIRI